MKTAARLGDRLLTFNRAIPRISRIMNGCPTVLIGGMPAACIGHGDGIDAIVQGSSTVFINGMPAARVGDHTATGGHIMPPGAVHVLIG
ncbi:PAAR domain-containing protein [Methylobacillus arboreus]|uniref:PAAR domain-containing protein n=1 Tax=Methylobacillus arboreus TaxID=755170 RepID=UPI001E58E292|nr:PAAR domain-containing protein [Methylobacillus arboreus]MCB5191716.1 PAAR domain-containing protein [Methylobacillus arboreus]